MGRVGRTWRVFTLLIVCGSFTSFLLLVAWRTQGTLVRAGPLILSAEEQASIPGLKPGTVVVEGPFVLPLPEFAAISRTILEYVACVNGFRAGKLPSQDACQPAQLSIQWQSQQEMDTALVDCKLRTKGPCRFYSQQHEDAVMYNMFFNTKRSGTYLELGALDGLTYSNTLFFEETLGWNGVLIESSDQYRSLRVHRNTSKNKLFHNTVCDEGLVVVSGSDAMAGIEGAWDARHGHLDGAKLVRCKTLGSIIRSAGVTSIDLWFLDVEGAELQVLLSMDWSIPVSVLVIERNHNDALIEVLLTSLGFTYVRQQRGNTVWARAEFLRQQAEDKAGHTTQDRELPSDRRTGRSDNLWCEHGFLRMVSEWQAEAKPIAAGSCAKPAERLWMGSGQGLATLAKKLGGCVYNSSLEVGDGAESHWANDFEAWMEAGFGIRADLASLLTAEIRPMYKGIGHAIKQGNPRQFLKVEAISDTQGSSSSVLVVKNALVTDFAAVRTCDIELMQIGCLNEAARLSSGHELSNIPFVEAWNHREPSEILLTIAIPRFSNTYFHFWIESVSKLPTAYSALPSLAVSNVTIHVGAINRMVVEVLQLLGFKQDQIVTGIQAATLLIVPRPVDCGRPKASSLRLLRKTIIQTLSLRPTVLRRASSSPLEQSAHDSQVSAPAETLRADHCVIVLVQRLQHATVRRILNERELAVGLGSTFPSCKLVRHNGTETLSDQLGMFRSATAVVAPHGAGLSNLVACSRGTIVIEFLLSSDINLCYLFIAAKLSLRYISMVPPALDPSFGAYNFVVDVRKVVEVLGSALGHKEITDAVSGSVIRHTTENSTGGTGNQPCHSDGWITSRVMYQTEMSCWLHHLQARQEFSEQGLNPFSKRDLSEFVGLQKTIESLVDSKLDGDVYVIGKPNRIKEMWMILTFKRYEQLHTAASNRSFFFLNTKATLDVDSTAWDRFRSDMSSIGVWGDHLHMLRGCSAAGAVSSLHPRSPASLLVIEEDSHASTKQALDVIGPHVQKRGWIIVTAGKPSALSGVQASVPDKTLRQAADEYRAQHVSGNTDAASMRWCGTVSLCWQVDS